MQHYVEIIGMMAGVCTTGAFLPQMFRVLRTRSTSAISLPMYVILSLGVGLWIIYGMLMDAFAVMLFNSITLAFSISILIMKIMWK